MAKAKPNPVVVGRRICNGPCGRWRPIVDFIHKADARADQGRYIAGLCSYCNKAYGKRWYQSNRDAHIARQKRWKAENPHLVARYKEKERIKRRTPEEREKERIRQRKRWRDPEMARRLRAYYREYRREVRAMKRHEALVAVGETRQHKNPTISGMVPLDERMPLEPFVAWIESKLEVYVTPGALAKACGTTERLLYRFRKGEADYAPLSTVDALLTNEGTTQLWELYPSLFEDESDQSQIAA